MFGIPLEVCIPVVVVAVIAVEAALHAFIAGAPDEDSSTRGKSRKRPD